MKTKLNLIVLSLFVLVLSSCGKETSSIGNSSNVNTVSITTDGSTVVGTSNNNFTTIDQVRAAFNSMSLESGVTTGTYIYHTESRYSNSSSSSSISISGCLFGLLGDCDNTSNSNLNTQLQGYLNNGRVLQVGNLNSDTSTLNVNEAIDVSSNDFIFDSYVYSRNSSDYAEMLGLDDIYQQTKVSPVSIELRNGTIVDAVVVEFISSVFTSISSIKRYVLTTNLPVAANPVAIIEGTTNLQVTGLLRSVGMDIQISRINIDRLTALDAFSGTERVITNSVIQLN